MIELQELQARIQASARSLMKVQGELLGAAQMQRRSLEESVRQRTKKIHEDSVTRLRIAMIRAQDRVTSKNADALNAARELLNNHDPDVLKVAQYLCMGHIHFDGRMVGMGDDYDIPLIVRMLCNESLAIFGNTKDSDAVVRTAILEALRGTAPAQLQVVGYDPALKTPEASFAALNNVAENSIVNLQTVKELDSLIRVLTDDITRISAMLRGSEITLAEYRLWAGMPIEQYKLVVMHEYPLYVSEEQHNRIMTLLKRGAQFGITFLFDMGDESRYPDWFDRQRFMRAVDTFTVSGRRDVWGKRPSLHVSFTRTSPEDAITGMDELIVKAASVQIPKVSFAEIQPRHDWPLTSENGVSFVVGREGTQTIEIVLGNERQQKHNALITGAVGQGKSNLLKVIIYSLCSRYSPEELNLYLLDFKEGVTLYPMAPTRESPQYLPHARVLGLEADQDFGVSVLKYLEQEFERRARLFKPYGDNILKYRKANPDAIMPRIVLIIDEFHMMLDNTSGAKTGSKAAELLERIVRRGRSYGVHVILASQSISGIAALITSGQGVFSQFPIRIGLKNSPKEALSTFGQNNDASAHLRYRGQAIVNLDYGDPASNQTVMVAAADDDELNRLRDEWYERSHKQMSLPVVFDGSKASDLLADLNHLGELGSRTVTALLGHPVRVDQKPVGVRLFDAPGRNLAILGAGTSPNALPDDVDNNMGIGSVEAAGISIAKQAKTKGSMDFIVLDMLNDVDRSSNHVADWLDAMRRSGQNVEVVMRRDFVQWLDEFSAGLPNRTGGEHPVYILGLSVDRAGTFDRSQEKAFQSLLDQGPIADVHVIAWWSNTVAFLKQMGLARAQSFDATMMLFGAGDVAKTVHGPLTEWAGQENRGLYYDKETMTDSVKVIPYMPLSVAELTQLWKES
ncbi:FtsK/SpoIIIE domain-containing protein [Bifidobacterium pullorum]|uniref:FtsK/SpoIIIE domain-containing protein n=1 Tax=Bifidobacterium pullorum TaxID=78448 RepID=UPI0025A4C7EA|nr:FtsK/SpoIIIE domain-containing protein [Bifidobacterium pullorum]MDM8323282.1 FtsK/SpoIIIE domain-containing protein [Bifidobacterium pullorum]